MCDLLLLLMIRLHLIYLVFGFCSDICRVITTIVHELLLHCQIHDVRTDGVHEILGMRREDEDMVVCGEIRLEPDDRSEIEMVSRLIKEEKMRLDEECASEGDTHTPPTTHVFRRTLHHFLAETKTMKNTTSLGFEGIGVQLLQLLVCGIKRELVYIVCHGEILNPFLELGNFVSGRSNDVIDSVDIRGLCFTTDEVDVDMFGDFNIPLSDRLEESRLQTTHIVSQHVSPKLVFYFAMQLDA